VADEALCRVELKHRYADLEDVRLHLVEAEEGPLVLLLHGFPQFWYEWRHQILAVVKADFRLVAPDMRGYNLSDKPPGVLAYRPPPLLRKVLFCSLRIVRGLLARIIGIGVWPVHVRPSRPAGFHPRRRRSRDATDFVVSRGGGRA